MFTRKTRDELTAPTKRALVKNLSSRTIKVSIAITKKKLLSFFPYGFIGTTSSHPLCFLRCSDNAVRRT
jgi:hypothetical protein